tara:strand:+ start:1076 stop:2263 length:1188 start_codon:yes stop_codon:yes gene_type:complete
LKIGIVLIKTPSFSEKFLISKIENLQKLGHEVILFVNKRDDFNICKVVDMPKVSKALLVQVTKMLLTYLSILIRSPRAAINFLKLEKQDGVSFCSRLENLYLNSKILTYNLDWLHFSFAAITFRKENVAKSINAQMGVSLRGYDVDVYPLKNQNCYSLMWKKVDKVHSISYSLLKKAKKFGLDSSITQQVIFPAIDTARFQNKEIKKPLNTKKKIEILTVARLHWIKGLDYTIEAMGKLTSINFSYTIVGDGVEYERLISTINELNLNNKVRLVGYIPNEDLVPIYKKADIYIQYSIEEGFCNAVLEAQSMGVLTIVSDASGLMENIIDGKTGWIVPKREPISLANKIIQVTSMKEEKLNSFRLNAIKRVKSKFDINTQAKYFNSFFNESLFQKK